MFFEGIKGNKEGGLEDEGFFEDFEARFSRGRSEN